MQALAAMPSAVAAAVRVVLTDIDDTLTTDGRLPADAYAALERLEQAGIQVVPITGRPGLVRPHRPHVAGARRGRRERGLLLCLRPPGPPHDRALLDDAAARQASRARLDAIRDRVLAEVPGAAVASDQDYRKADLAIDFCEDVPPLPEADVGRIVAIFEAAGAQAKVSSIHVNGWFGDYDKLTMTQTLFQREFGADVATLLDSTLFIGDSPNDEPMFAYFPISVGVATSSRSCTACNAGRPMWPPAMAVRASSRWPNGCWPPAPDPYPGKRRGDHTENHLAIRAQGHSAAANDGRRSIQSIEVGVPLLAALVDAGKPLTLRDLAAGAGMTSAKAHPIWSASSAWAWCSRTAPPASTSWDRSPCRWGWSACSGWTRCASPCPRSPSCNPRSATLGIAVLGSHGPTMIHMTEASYPVHVNMRKGTVMSMLHTATGLVFAAWLPPKVSEHYIAAKRATPPSSPA